MIPLLYARPEPLPNPNVVKADAACADTKGMSPVRALTRAGRPLLGLQAAMAVQAAAFAGGLALFAVGRWQSLAVGAAAGSLVLAWFLGRQTRSAWAMGLAFQTLLVALGATALSAGVTLPGAAVALLLVVVLVLPDVRGLFTAQAPAAPPVRLTAPVVASSRAEAPSLPPPPAFPPPGSRPLVSQSLAPAPPSVPPPPPPGRQPRTA